MRLLLRKSFLLGGHHRKARARIREKFDSPGRWSLDDPDINHKNLRSRCGSRDTCTKNPWTNSASSGIADRSFLGNLCGSLVGNHHTIGNLFHLEFFRDFLYALRSHYCRSLALWRERSETSRSRKKRRWWNYNIIVHFNFTRNSFDVFGSHFGFRPGGIIGQRKSFVNTHVRVK